MQCVILAGGLGTRISSITQNKVPKAMIKVNDLPFIDYQLQRLSKCGFNKIVLCVSYLKEQIKEYVKDGSKWNLFVDYVDDGESPLGTGGAIRKAYDENVLEDHFMIIYGDSFLPVDYNIIYNFYNNQNYLALMAVYKNNNNLDISNVKFDGFLVDYNKFNTDNTYEYIDYGLSILDKRIVFEYIPENQKYDLALLFNKLSSEKKLLGYEVHERFYEIGSVSGLIDFERFLKDEKINNNS